MAETEEPVGLTKEETVAYATAARWHRKGGRPDKALLLDICVQENRPIEDRSLLRTDGVQPVAVNVDLPPMPPRAGKGASNKAWRTWVKEATDWLPEVIDSKTKIELVAMLEANGIIPRSE